MKCRRRDHERFSVEVQHIEPCLWGGGLLRCNGLSLMLVQHTLVSLTPLPIVIKMSLAVNMSAKWAFIGF